ncbi:MAG TPA: pyruvate kinase [Verrucomicrobiota bacterium]|nr:pyruvate kinase [Verrucomicrobiota bacterium]HOP97984.1 pyruvate kinase [Verrucomicrobiota bacterium]
MPRRTKIVATLGPATDSAEMIGRLLDAGVDVVRLNMSHAPHDWVRRVVREVRRGAEARDRFVAIMMDTQGPAIRTGELRVPLDLQPGQKFTLTVRGERSEEERSVDVNYANFVNDIDVGDVVLIDNGTIQMKVLGKAGNKVECEVLTKGKLGSRRHINLPGVKVSLPALTAKDISDVQLGLELGVDLIALSFVREARDLLQLRELFSGQRAQPLVIAKIEDQQAVENFNEIVRAADGIMVARGDLGIEIPYEELPIVQRRVVKTCLHVGKPVIVATHMLESMIESPMPTRAEVTDVANAVYEQADAIMLSGETSVGKYPLKCIEVFDRIASRIERSGGANFYEQAELVSARQKLVKSAVVMANELRAEAILVITRSGNMARYTAWWRPRYSKIYALCPSASVAAGLALSWGVTPFVVPFDLINPENTIEAALKMLVGDGRLQRGMTVVVIGSVLVGEQVVDAVQMRVV